MKRKFFLLSFLLAMVILPTGCEARSDMPVSFEQLPAKAQAFINQHFANQKIRMILKDDDYYKPDYEVLMESGIKITFYNNGDWDEVDGHQQPIPTTFIPAAILEYTAANYANLQIVEIDKDKDRQQFDVKLTNAVELIFDSNGKFVRVDYDD